MIRTIAAGIICTASMLLSHPVAFAQSIPLDESPIDYRERPGSKGYLSVFVGPSFNQQLGSFSSRCDCIFDGGGGNGLVLGAAGAYSLGSSWALGVRALYEDRQFTAAYREYETVEFVPQTGRSFVTPVLFRHQADVTTSLLSISPYIEFTPARWLVLQAGISPSFVLSSNTRHTKELLQSVVRDDLGTEYRVGLGDDGLSRSSVVEDETTQDYSSFVFSSFVSAGFVFNLSSRLALHPLLVYSLPLSSWSSADPSWSVSSVQLLFGIRYSLGKQEKVVAPVQKRRR